MNDKGSFLNQGIDPKKITVEIFLTIKYQVKQF